MNKDLEKLAQLLDSQVKIPFVNMRFGLDAILGLIPGVGDAVSTALSSYIFVRAIEMKCPKVILLRMLANMGIDFFIGLIPFLGDIADVIWKSNLKNVELLNRYGKNPKKATQTTWLLAALIGGSVIGFNIWLLSLIFN